MFSQKLKYFLYGSLASASLITVATQATTGPDGVFGDYFINMITDVGTCMSADAVVTGFKTSPYGQKECTTFQEIIKSVFKNSSGGVGKVVIGFDANGNPKYDFTDWSSLTSKPLFVTNQVSGRVTIKDTGCGFGYGSSCDILGNGTIDNADNATNLGGIVSTGYQRRVTGTCSPYESMKGINADGSVMCGVILPPLKPSIGVKLASYFAGGQPPVPAGAIETFEGCGMYCGYSPNEGEYNLYGSYNPVTNKVTIEVGHGCRYPSKCGGVANHTSSVVVDLDDSTSGNFSSLYGGGGHAWVYNNKCLYVYRDGSVAGSGCF